MERDAHQNRQILSHKARHGQEMAVQQHHTAYRKIDDEVVTNVGKKSKSIAEKLRLDDRIETKTTKEPFIKL